MLQGAPRASLCAEAFMPFEADLEAFSPGPVAAHNVRGRAVIYIVTLNVRNRNRRRTRVATPCLTRDGPLATARNGGPRVDSENVSTAERGMRPHGDLSAATPARLTPALRWWENFRCWLSTWVVL